MTDTREIAERIYQQSQDAHLSQGRDAAVAVIEKLVQEHDNLARNLLAQQDQLNIVMSKHNVARNELAMMRQALFKAARLILDGTLSKSESTFSIDCANPEDAEALFDALELLAAQEP